MATIRYILTLFATISYTVITAQANNYFIQHYNIQNGLPQNSIKAIEIDKKGYLWLATEMGLARFDGSNFKYYDRTNSPELETDRILNIGLMKDGNVFAQVEDRSFYYTGVNGVLQPIPKNYNDINILNNFSVIKIYTIYKTCKSKYEKGQIAEWALPDYALISNSLFNSLVYLNGCYYYFNKYKDLIAADTSLTTFRKIILKGQLPFSSISNKNTKIELVALISRNNTLYVRLNDYIYQVSFINTRYAFAKPVLEVGNITNIISFLEVPKFSMFVVGTSSDGLYIFQKHSFSVLTIKDNASNVFYAQAPYGFDGVLTNAGVLYPNRFIPLPTKGYTYESILKTTDGNYLLSRMHDETESGVVELDDQLHELGYIRDYNMHVNCFRQLKDRSIWISLKDNRFAKIENNQIKWIDVQKSLPKDFRVNSFIGSSKNELWIAGYKGLVRINLATGTTHVIPELMNIEVRNLYEDKRGTIWIGTYGNGYYAFYKGKCLAMPMDEKHFLATAHTFMEDNSGNVWITSNRGLFQARMTDLYNYLSGKSEAVYYYYYDKTAGFLTNEFNGGCTPSGIILNNGKFSLPSIKGLVQFYPDSIKPVYPDARIYVDAIIGDTTVFNNIDNKPLSVPPYINHLQFYISSPYFGNSYNQCLEYKLNKLDDTWYKIGKNGIVQFNKLAPGNYRLQLRKKGGFGSENYITGEVLFSVTPFFYQTWLFKLLMLASLVALVYSFFRLRILFLTHQKTELEIEVSKKTKEQESLIGNLETTVAELEKTQEELYLNNRLKEELVLLVAHDLQSPFRFISSTTQRLFNTLSEKQYHEAEVLCSELNKYSMDTYRFVEDFTLWVSTLGRTFHLQNTGVNLHNLLMELSRFFTELLAMKKNKLEINIDKSLEVFTDSQLLKIILRNIIDNANKHTLGGTIHIIGKIDNSTACIIITDNGKGMNDEVLKKIQFLMKYGSDRIDNTKKLHGNGYRFITDFCNLLNIHLEVESKWGEGTTVRLTNLKI